MPKPYRNRLIIYGIIFLSVSLLTFFGLDYRNKNTYQNAPLSPEQQIIVEQYRIKKLEHKIEDLRSGDYKKRMRALGGSDTQMSDDLIRKELIETEKELKQARKRLDRLIRK